MSTTVLITGSKSGIGKGLLSAYALRPNTTAIAAIRNGADSPSAATLSSLPVGKGSKIIVEQYDASSKTAATELVSALTAKHGITVLDIVYGNAGILKAFGPVKEVSAEDLFEHFSINTVAQILLYEATQPLLNASAQEPKFFVVSSILGSNANQDAYAWPIIAYGMSKAAINYALGKIHREEPRIVAIPFHPGWVQTAMGERAAEMAGMEKGQVPVTLEESVTGLLATADIATKQEHSGKLLSQNGEILAW